MVHAIALGLFAALFLFFYTFARFSYETTRGHLCLRWRLPGGIPYWSRRVPLVNIAEVKRCGGFGDLLPTCDIWGNLPSKRGVIIRLHRGWIRRVFVTPDDPESFAKELSMLAFSAEMASLELPL